MKLDCGKKFDIKAKKHTVMHHLYGDDCIATQDNANNLLNLSYKGLKAEGIARAAAAAAGGPGASLAVSVASKAIKRSRLICRLSI